MKKIKQNITRFLRKYRMDYLDVDINLVIDSFLSEMQRGLAGKKSTLDMIPTYIEVGADVPTNKRVIVVDAGGTNLRVATVYFDDHKKAVIENLHLYKMPGVLVAFQARAEFASRRRPGNGAEGDNGEGGG